MGDGDRNFRRGSLGCPRPTGVHEPQEPTKTRKRRVSLDSILDPCRAESERGGSGAASLLEATSLFIDSIVKQENNILWSCQHETLGSLFYFFYLPLKIVGKTGPYLLLITLFSRPFCLWVQDSGVGPVRVGSGRT